MKEEHLQALTSQAVIQLSLSTYIVVYFTSVCLFYWPFCAIFTCRFRLSYGTFILYIYIYLIISVHGLLYTALKYAYFTGRFVLHLLGILHYMTHLSCICTFI